MYRLEVIRPGSDKASHSELVQRASEAMARIPDLMKEHDGCEKIVVFLDNARLFAVDCKGNQLNG